MTRRYFLKGIISAFFILVSVFTGTYIYAYYIEPRMLKNSRKQIHSKYIPKAFNDFKIVQFSDTHIGFQYTVEHLKQLVKKINAEKANIIVFTGDLIDEPQTFTEKQKLINTLKHLRATDGKYWVYGNHDHGGYGTELIKDIMQQAGFSLLNNEHITIEKSSERIIIAGIDDVMLGKPDLERTLKDVNDNDYTILLAHEPDIADRVATYPVDLQLSGHSHGGQVRLPYFGHLYTPPYAEKYVRGKYLLNDKQMTLFVSTGIGTTRLPLRFLCQPQFYTFTLNNKNV